MTTIPHTTLGLEPAGFTDHRRALLPPLNVVPTSTGAAKAIGLGTAPRLKGKLDGLRLAGAGADRLSDRPDLRGGSRTGVEEVNKDRQGRRRGPLKGTSGICSDPIVSSDIVWGLALTCIFDSGPRPR